MQIIDLDATKWKTVVDFYDAILAAVGAPKGHGKSPDALIDSMIWGGMNAVESPYTIRISGLSMVPSEVRDYVGLVRDVLAEGRNYRKRHQGDDVEVSIQIVGASDGNVTATAQVQYEGPDPNLRAITENLRRQLKLGPDRER